jgi:hypothetical protein
MLGIERANTAQLQGSRELASASGTVLSRRTANKWGVISEDIHRARKRAIYKRAMRDQ